MPTSATKTGMATTGYSHNATGAASAVIDFAEYRTLMAERQPVVSVSTILSGFRGSVAHNMWNSSPDSIDDIDIMAVCVPAIDCYFGLREFGSRGTIEVKAGRWDVVAYEALKFIRLLAQGNPNVLSLLWLRPEHYIQRLVAGDMLIDRRDLFAGRHVYASFCGYASAQLARLQRVAHTDQAYQYAKRREMFREFGYDCKAACCLIRLLRMGVEYLQTGILNVWREDAAELLEIKRGEWSLARIEAEAERLFAAAKEARDASPLPEDVDMAAVNGLALSVVETALDRGRIG